jgi:hypothetical protein
MLILIVKSFGSTNKGVDRVHSKYVCTIDIEYMLYKKNEFSEIQHCGKRGVNRGKEDPDAECL